MEQIFISSVQKEFREERRALKDFIRGDPLLRQFFDVFLFEDLPASDRRADEVYLAEVDRCDIYLGIFGKEYGYEDKEGVSPTEREFDRATKAEKERLIFIKGYDDSARYAKMLALARKAGDLVIRRRFESRPELTAELYASLIEYLGRKGAITTRPFDAAACPHATLADLSEEKLSDFLARAQRARGYVLGPETLMPKALAHLNLLDGDVPNHAAILLFGEQPQRFLPTSIVKCLHFHGTEIQKPIPSYQVYKGTVFELVSHAVDFVLSKLNRTVGTRDMGPQAPVTYDIPPDALAEAIVNAVAHRDYASNASVQIMLFSDRLEVWNPGHLPPPLTFDMLRRPHPSIPRNPLIAEPLFLTRLIERAGTGTLDMAKLCKEAGLPPPEFRESGGQFIQALRRAILTTKAHGKGFEVCDEDRAIGQLGTKLGLSRDQVLVIKNLVSEQGVIGLMGVLGRTNRTKFRDQVLNPMIESGFVEMTAPDKPRSSKQKYRLTEKGHAILSQLRRQRDT